jgi:6-phosphogluconolactonase
VRVFSSLQAASKALAQELAALARQAVTRQGRWVVALSGGETPRGLYETLAGLPPGAVPWAQTHILWADERCVPREDPASNYRLVRETLLEKVAVPAAQVHPLVSDPADPEGSALAAEALLSRLYPGGPPRLDAVVLGLGEDGHTASLFPGSPVLQETRRLVAVVNHAPKPPPCRLTLTLPALQGAAEVHFLVSGAGKSEALRQALNPDSDLTVCPAVAVRPREGRLVWWVDEAAWGE